MAAIEKTAGPQLLGLAVEIGFLAADGREFAARYMLFSPVLEPFPKQICRL